MGVDDGLPPIAGWIGRLLGRTPRRARLPIAIGCGLMGLLVGEALATLGTTPETQWMEPLAILILLVALPLLAYSLTLGAVRLWRSGRIGLRVAAVPLALLALPPLLYFLFLMLVVFGVVHVF